MHSAKGLQLWAVVKKDGTLVRGHGLAPSNPPTRKEATGIYRVTFNRDVDGCSYQATIGNPDTTSPVQDSQVTVSAFPGKKDAVIRARPPNRLIPGGRQCASSSHCDLP